MIDATVVIPTYNGAGKLISTLDALVAAAPAPGWEAVVVDDGSTDSTADTVAAWARASGAPVRVVRQENAGPAAARNAGAASAHGRNLIFMDDDILVSDGFVTAHLAALAENPGCWIVGRVVLPEGLRSTSFGHYLDEMHEGFHRGHLPDRPSPTAGMTACSLSLPAEDFRALGGFDEDFTIASGEDWELGMRARQRGIRILYDPRIVAVHEDWAIDLARFCERQRLYSISDVLLCHKYGTANPRWALVTASGPLRMGREPLTLSVKKIAKAALATRPGHTVVDVACQLASFAAPDSALSSRAYDLAAAVAVFEGVREGIRRYGDPIAAGGGAVLHLIDANRSTAYFTSIARHADRGRHPVVIGSIAPAGPLQVAMEEAGVGTFALGATTRWQYLVALVRLVRLILDDQPAITHAHCFDPTLLGLAAARLTRTRFVFTRHHSDHNIRMGKRWHTRVDAWCARHADHVIAVSEATRRVLVDQEGVADDHVTVVLNGMEPMEVVSESARSALAEDLRLDADEPVCLMMARLHEEKGHRVLFDAIADVVAAVGPIQFLLVGDGPDRSALESDVARRRLDGVRFLGQRTDIAALISLSTVVVQPSLAESFGFAALEASSLGRPVVASDAGGLPEVVVDGVTGLVVPAGDSRSLAEALCRLLKDPEWAEELGRAGRDWAGRFTAHRMVTEYEQVYKRVREGLNLVRREEGNEAADRLGRRTRV
jgi:glycosyltransferase involved in cell wall biosynthesis/GT2 family glycosyltransferase